MTAKTPKGMKLKTVRVAGYKRKANTVPTYTRKQLVRTNKRLT